MMTRFGEWLGINNGKEMVADCLADCSKEQARAVITTYCIMFGIEVDTAGWSDIMQYVYDYYNSWFNDKDELDNYMCELLV